MRSRATRRRVARKISTPTLHSKERDVTLSSVVEKGDRAGKLNEKKGRREEGKRRTQAEIERERRRKMRETSTGRKRGARRLHECTHDCMRTEEEGERVGERG